MALRGWSWDAAVGPAGLGDRPLLEALRRRRVPTPLVVTRVVAMGRWAPEPIRPALAAVVAGWREGAAAGRRAPAAGRFPGGGRPGRDAAASRQAVAPTIRILPPSATGIAPRRWHGCSWGRGPGRRTRHLRGCPRARRGPGRSGHSVSRLLPFETPPRPLPPPDGTRPRRSRHPIPGRRESCSSGVS